MCRISLDPRGVRLLEPHRICTKISSQKDTKYYFIKAFHRLLCIHMVNDEMLREFKGTVKAIT